MSIGRRQFSISTWAENVITAMSPLSPPVTLFKWIELCNELEEKEH